jgi:glycosyltransferase involved in cell wall biosynthesis
VAGPLVTVVIPVRDEEERLAGCLDALAASDLPHGEVEVLVVDGGSSDGTVEVARRGLAGQGWWRGEVLHSAAGDRSSNLNCGLAAASAAVLVRVDARSRVPAGYVRRCLDLLESRPDVAVVGGRQQAVAGSGGWLDAGVARALNNRWGMGLARYRRSGSSGEADTVYLGAYRTAELRAAGGWRTDLAVNEDFDLNRRLRRFGVVWFEAGLAVGYVPRASLAALLTQYWAFGTGKARYWRMSGDRPQRRQALLLGAPVVAMTVIAGTGLLLGGAAAAVLVGAGLVAAVAVEVAGSDGPRAGLLGHLAAVAALACVAGAWLVGVAVGFFRPVPQLAERTA